MNLEEHFCLSQEDGEVSVHRGGTVEGRSAELKDEKQDSQRKNIGLNTFISFPGLSVFDLWGEVRLSSVLGGNVLMNFLSEPEVAELELVIVIYEHVLQLDVTVSVFGLGVKSVETVANLGEKVLDH